MIFKGETWEWIKVNWQSGRKGTALTLFLNRFPRLTYPEGEAVYLQKLKKVGGYRFTGEMAGPTWWHELFHFLGGFLLSVPFIFSPRASFILLFAVSGLSGLNEFFLDGKTHPDLKNFADWFFWTSGASVSMLLSCVFFGPTVYQ